MNKPLINNFENVSTKQWKQKIQFDLKGADYNETLVYKSLEGIDIKPFYNQEDIPNTTNHTLSPTSWKNTQKIEVSEEISGNQKAIEAIQKGAESIYFVIANKNINPKKLLTNITKETTVFIKTLFLSDSYSRQLNTIAKQSEITIHIMIDIIGNIASTGNWFNTLKEDHKTLETILNQCPDLKSTISIDTGLYQNAGATIVQQLAYGLAHANEYLNHLESTPENPLKKKPIIFKVAVGGNYFFEIAKLKALRILWKTLASEYNILNTCIILAFPSHRNKTILDYNVNMLRTTTECMSAILGEADFVHNIPYDNVYNLENQFGTRISTNQLLILKNESHFDIVSNPTSGSYYIENLTHQLAEKALSLFKNIEESGGYLLQLKSTTIQKKIAESALKEQKLFDNKNIILTGTNKYQNPEESLPIFQKSPFLEKKIRKTLLPPIIKRRLSEKIEQNHNQNSFKKSQV